MKKTKSKTPSMQGAKQNKTHIIAGCGVLTAVAAVLQFIEISIPIMPSFVKLDFSDLPELIGAFAYGPVAGIVIALLKNIIHLPFSGSMYIGELSNFILGAAFAGVAGYVYKQKKTLSNAIVAGVSGAVFMGLLSIAENFFIVYPLYYGVLNFPEEAVLGMYQVIRKSTASIAEALIVFNMPFTIVKGLISVLVSMIIYKPLSPILHNRKKQPTAKTAENE